jgi:hypothetical protein
VETYGQVTWAGPSGQCGIRFVDLPLQTARQIDQWIFSNLLDGIEPEGDPGRSIFGPVPSSLLAGREDVVERNDGLTVSVAGRPAIRVEPQYARTAGMFTQQHREQNLIEEPDASDVQPSWLSRPISGQTLAWLVDSLVMIAGLLLFALIFLSITHELPPWPLAAGAISSGAVLVGAAYWGVFAVFGGASLGARLAGSPSVFKQEEEPEEARRFR